MNLPLRAARSITFQHHPTMTACWVWVGRTDSRGIGYYSLDGQVHTARQAVYMMLVGATPARLTSRCGVSACVNPHHMKEGK